MGLANFGSRYWERTSVSERIALLKNLKTAMGEDQDFWGEKDPIEVFANTPDFNSLPSDLCGILILCLTPFGFSVDKFKEFLERLGS